MEILQNGNIIEPIINVNYVRGKRASIVYQFNIDDTPVVFSISGNYTDKDGNFYSTETLFKAWKDYIGKEINGGDLYGLRIVSDVYINGEYIFIEAVKKVN